LRGEDETEATEHDINLVVKYSLGEMVQEGLLEESSSNLLEQQLVTQADQTFLWVALIISLVKDATEDGASQHDLKAILDDRSIDSIYATLLAQNTQRPETERQARILLQIIVAAPRPMSLIEMDIAISLRPEHESCDDLKPYLHNDPERYLKKLCGHFIRCKDQKVYLVHQTARDFLIRQDQEKYLGEPCTGTWQHWIVPAVSQALLATICIHYLFLRDFQNGAEDFASYRLHGLSEPKIRQEYCRLHPFMEYAATYWHYHARLGQSEIDDSVVKAIWILGNTRSSRFWTWFWIYSPRWSAAIVDEPTVLHYLALGNGKAFENVEHLTCPGHINAYTSKDETETLKSDVLPYAWTQNKRCEAIADLLTKLKPSIQKQFSPAELPRQSIFNCADYDEGSPPASPSFLGIGSNLQWVDVVITEEIVKAAAGNYWRGEEVMKLLLEQRGADVVITEEVVKAAAGNEGDGREVMRLLLEQRGADVVITEEVVKAAAGNKRNGEKVMKLLLEQ
jgi:hypothetical protein